MSASLNSTNAIISFHRQVVNPLFHFCQKKQKFIKKNPTLRKNFKIETMNLINAKKKNKNGIRRNTAFEVISCSIPTCNNFCKAAAVPVDIFALFRFPCRYSFTIKANGSTLRSSSTATLRWIKKSNSFPNPSPSQPSESETDLIFFSQPA